MVAETITVSSNSSESMKSIETISILVVDDDTTCLAVLATILKKFRYEVVTVKHPNDALYTLRIKGGAFDLVVSDVHMPDMNGFELQQAISQEFSTLPVVLMSADREEGIVLRGLESGAAYFLSKPISANDLKDLWQFAYMKKKSKVVIEETGSFSEEKNSSSDDDNNNSDAKAIFSSSSSVDVNGNTHNKDSKRKSPINEGSDEKTGESSNSCKQKKQKLVWTNSLHDRFLEAIRTLGLEKAVPKKILEFMKVPGLTRANVASHLQKYRIFLRRVTDTTLRIQYPADNDAFTSSFAFGTTSSILMHLNRLTRLHNQTSSVSNLFPQSGFGQSRLLSNSRSLLFQNIGNTSQVDRASVRLSNNKYATSGLIQGNLSNIALEASSSAISASFHASLLGSTQANSVGLKISNILPHLVGSGLPDGTINFQNLNSVNGAPTPSGDSIINLDLLTKQFGATSSSSSFLMPGTNSGGDMLSDVIAEYQMLLPSNLPLLGNVENGGEETYESPYTPIFDFTEFSSDQQSLEECELNSTFADQVNLQNTIHQNGCESSVTMSGFYGGTSHWDNHVTPSDQASNQCDDEDFMEYLLAPSPFPEDHSSCEQI